MPALGQDKALISLKHSIESSITEDGVYRFPTISQSNITINIYLDQTSKPNISICSIQLNFKKQKSDNLIFDSYLSEKNLIREIRNVRISFVNKIEKSIEFFEPININIEECTLYKFDQVLEIHVLIEKEGPLYHLTIFISLVGGKLDGVDVLLNDRRRKIYEYIISNPGAYFREIMRAHGLGPNSAKYHLDTLEDHGYVHSGRCGRYLTYFSKGSKVDKNQTELHITLQNKNAQKILEIVVSNPGITPMEIQEKTELHRNTVNYNLNKLIKIGLLEKIRQKGRSHLIYREFKPPSFDDEGNL